MLQCCLIYWSGFFVTLGLIKCFNKHIEGSIDKIELNDAIMLSFMSWIGFVAALLYMVNYHVTMLSYGRGGFYKFISKLKRWIEG